MALFATKLIKTLLLYPPKVRSGIKGALMASVAGLSLTHTVGKAVWSGLFTSGKPFLRTPKCDDPALFSQVLRVVWQETTLLVLPAGGDGLDGVRPRLRGSRRELWMVMLGVQSLPYAATFVTASISAHVEQEARTPRRCCAGSRFAAEGSLKPLRTAGTVFPGLRMFFGSKARLSGAHRVQLLAGFVARQQIALHLADAVLGADRAANNP